MALVGVAAVKLQDELAAIKLDAMRERAGIRRPGDPVTPMKDRPRCGARTRTGRPCRRRPVWDNELDMPRNGRCRNHGGLSTGRGKRRKR